MKREKGGVEGCVCVLFSVASGRGMWAGPITNSSFQVGTKSNTGAKSGDGPLQTYHNTTTRRSCGVSHAQVKRRPSRPAQRGLALPTEAPRLLDCRARLSCTLRHQSRSLGQATVSPVTHARCCTRGEVVCRHHHSSHQSQYFVELYWPDPSMASQLECSHTRPERSPCSAGAYSVAGLLLRTFTPGHRDEGKGRTQ